MRLVFISSVMATSALRTISAVIGSTVAVGSSSEGPLILSSRRAEIIISNRRASDGSSAPAARRVTRSAPRPG